MTKRLRKTVAGVLVLSMLAGTGAWNVQAATTEEGYTIDEKTFPDSDVFYSAMRADRNNDGILSKAEAADVEELDIYTATADVSKYLKIFPNVKKMYITSGNNKQVVVNSSKIEDIVVRGDHLTALKGASPKMIRVTVNKDSGTLDFSKAEGYSKATAFYVTAEKATKIIAPNAAKLEKVGISYCNLGKIDASVYKNAKELSLDGNKLKSIDLRKNTKLTSLSCYDNKITSLNISANSKLKDIGVGGNQLKTIDVSKNKNMLRVVAYSNKLQSLKAAKGNKIKELDLSYNKFSTLDLANYPSLTTLYCNGNKLKTLSLAKNNKLSELSLRDTSANKVTFAKNTKLSDLMVDPKDGKFIQGVELCNKAYVYVEIKTGKQYELQKMIPALKGYTFSSDNENMSKDGVVKADKMKKYDYISCTAKKGSKKINVSIRAY